MASPNRIKKFYQERVNDLAHDDFLSQVGHTEKGKPISKEHFRLMLMHVYNALELTETDALLELCCGNGVFAGQLSANVRRYFGVDFSLALINLAQQHHRTDNTIFAVGDVTNLEDLDTLQGRKFSKVFMNASLQHFNPKDADQLLDGILPFLTNDARVFLSCIPLKGRERFLFGTVRKRLQRAYLKLTNQDIFGHWWSIEDISGAASRRRFDVEQIPIPESLVFSTYRFSVLLRRK